MSKTYSAGIVTAYGAAKRAGYQGTYEDFCRQQAGYAESAAAVEQAKNIAVSAANTATTKAGEASTAATAAQTAKTQTEAAASRALTDISTARSGAISAVQTEGQTQTANARAQAQAAAQSATTASAKASEASASATSAGLSATNAATSATSAAQSASNAQDVLESIPADYSALSANVSQLQADLGDLDDNVNDLKSAFVTPQMFGAHADGVTDDTIAIQNAIDSGIRVLFPKGVYIVSAPLVITKAGTVLEGVNNYDYTSTLNGAKIKIKENTWSDAFFKFEHGADNSIIRNLQMEGTPPGLTGAYQPTNGILFDSAVSDEFVAGCCFENLFISYCTRGVSMNSIFKTRFINVYVSNCRAYGFFLAGKAGVANATTLTLINCYANTCVRGYHISRVSYSSLINCASDNQTVVDYSIEFSNTISMQSCGSEGSSGNIILLGGSCNGFTISGFECISMQAIGSGLPDAVIYSNGASSGTISGVVYVGENPRTYDIQSITSTTFVVLGNTIEKTKCSRPNDVMLIPADLI